VAEVLASGTLTIPDLRNASSTTRTLGGMRKIPPETPLMVSQPPDPVLGRFSSAAADAPAPVAPAAEADELLCDLLLALSDDAWSALAAAVPDALAEPISRYLDS
jgi:hypothetical protein